MCKYCGNAEDWKDNTCGDCKILIDSSELTPRDHFAIAALQGLLASSPPESIAQFSPAKIRELFSTAPYIVADSLIENRFKEIKLK